MKSFLAMLCFLVIGDIALFAGSYTQSAWGSARSHLGSVQSYANDATASLLGG